MTINKARNLGIIYTFIVGLLCMIPLIFIMMIGTVTGYVADEKEIQGEDGTEILYDFNNMNQYDKAFIKEGFRHYFDIGSGMLLLFAIWRGGNIGKEVLISKSTKKHHSNLTRVLSPAFFWSTVIWIISFLILQKGMDYTFGNVVVDGFVLTILTLVGASGLSDFFGTPFLHKLFSFHKH